MTPSKSTRIRLPGRCGSSRCAAGEVPPVDPHLLPGGVIPVLPGQLGDRVRQRDRREVAVVVEAALRARRVLPAEQPVGVHREGQAGRRLVRPADAADQGEQRQRGHPRAADQAGLQHRAPGNAAPGCGLVILGRLACPGSFVPSRPRWHRRSGQGRLGQRPRLFPRRLFCAGCSRAGCSCAGCSCGAGARPAPSRHRRSGRGGASPAPPRRASEAGAGRGAVTSPGGVLFSLGSAGGAGGASGAGGSGCGGCAGASPGSGASSAGGATNPVLSLLGWNQRPDSPAGGTMPAPAGLSAPVGSPPAAARPVSSASAAPSGAVPAGSGPSGTAPSWSSPGASPASAMPGSSRRPR